MLPLIFIRHTVELDSTFSHYLMGAPKKTESQSLVPCVYQDHYVHLVKKKKSMNKIKNNFTDTLILVR